MSASSLIRRVDPVIGGLAVKYGGAYYVADIRRFDPAFLNAFVIRGAMSRIPLVTYGGITGALDSWGTLFLSVIKGEVYGFPISTGPALMQCYFANIDKSVPMGWVGNDRGAQLSIIPATKIELFHSRGAADVARDRGLSLLAAFPETARNNLFRGIHPEPPAAPRLVPGGVPRAVRVNPKRALDVDVVVDVANVVDASSPAKKIKVAYAPGGETDSEEENANALFVLAPGNNGPDPAAPIPAPFVPFSISVVNLAALLAKQANPREMRNLADYNAPGSYYQ